MENPRSIKPVSFFVEFFLMVFLVIGPAGARASDLLELSFQEAFEMALSCNHEIRIARESVEQGNLLEKQALTVLYPKLTGNAGYLWQSYPDGTDLDGLTWGVSLNQTIYDGGRAWIAKRGA